MENKIVIIFIGSLNIGGTEKQLLNLLKLIHKKYVFKIFTIQEKGSLAHEFEKLGIEVFEPDYKKKNSKIRLILFYSLLLYKILKIYLQFKPQVVHYYLPHSYIIAGFLCFLFKNTKFIMSRRSLNIYQKKYPFIKKIELIFHKRMEVITANSQSVYNELINEENVKLEKCRLIYNGITPRNRKRDKISESTNIICLANLLPYKNHSMIINALKDIPKNYKWNMHFVGRNSSGIKESLMKTIKKYDMEPNCFFHGQLSDPSKILSNSHIGVLTSDEEGFSNSILEYMNHSLAVIATDVGGNSESIVDKKTGFLVKRGDSVDLFNKFIYLLSNKDSISDFGNQGFLRVKEKFSMKRCAEQYTRLYEEIIKS